MSFKVKNNESKPSSVAGINPLAAGSTTLADSQPEDTSKSQNQAPTGSPSSSTIQSQGNTPPPQNQAQNAPKKPASSGMFTNIQKYVQKNKPQAQKMSTAVQQDFGQKAQQIRSAAEEKEGTFQTNLGAAQSGLQGSIDEASGAIENIMGDQFVPSPNQQPQPQQPTQAQETNQEQQPPSIDDSVSTVQNLLQEGPNVQDVAAINLAEQASRTAALQRLADSSQREQGRRALMQQTFGDRSYTRGQSDLDNLIMGGDLGARESLINAVRGESGALNEQIEGIKKQSQAELNNLQSGIEGFENEINELININREGLTQAEIDRIDAKIEERSAKLEEYKQLFEDEVNSYAQRLEDFANLSRPELADYLLTTAGLKFNNETGQWEGDDTSTLNQVMRQFGASRAYQDYLMNQAIERGAVVGGNKLSEQQLQDLFYNQMLDGQEVSGLIYDPTKGEYVINPAVETYFQQKVGTRSPLLGGPGTNYTYHELGDSYENVFGDTTYGKDPGITLPDPRDDQQVHYFDKDLRYDIFNKLYQGKYTGPLEDRAGSNLYHTLAEYAPDSVYDYDTFVGDYGTRTRYLDTYSIDDLLRLQESAKKQAEAIRNANIVDKIIQDEYGVSYDDLISGEDIRSRMETNPFLFAEEDTLNRYAALEKLANRDVLGPDEINRDYVSDADYFRTLKDRIGNPYNPFYRDTRTRRALEEDEWY